MPSVVHQPKILIINDTLELKRDPNATIEFHSAAQRISLLEEERKVNTFSVVSL
jgi:chaperonin GroEL (HSP60 family)